MLSWNNELICQPAPTHYPPDVCWRYVKFQFDPEAVIAIIYLNSLNAGLNDDITHFLHWEYIADSPTIRARFYELFPIQNLPNRSCQGLSFDGFLNVLSNAHFFRSFL